MREYARPLKSSDKYVYISQRPEMPVQICVRNMYDRYN